MRPSRRTIVTTECGNGRAATRCSNRFTALQEDENEVNCTSSTTDNRGNTVSVNAVSKSPRWVKKSLLSSTTTDCSMIYSVDRNIDNNVGAVMTVQGQWERIAMKIDSGAIDTVMPPNVASHFMTIETEASRDGPGFRAANGSAIKHHGQGTIKGIDDQYQPVSMKAQVADVRTTLGSVYQMLRAGNRVHFERGNCYIEHIYTGKKTRIDEKGGTFEVGVCGSLNPRNRCSRL